MSDRVTCFVPSTALQVLPAASTTMPHTLRNPLLTRPSALDVLYCRHLPDTCESEINQQRAFERMPRSM